MRIVESTRAATIARLLLSCAVGLPAGLLAALLLANASWVGIIGLVAPVYLAGVWIVDARALFSHHYLQPRFYLLALAASVALLVFYVGWLAANAD